MNNQYLTNRYWLILDSGGILRTPLNGWHLPEYIQRANAEYIKHGDDRGMGDVDYWLRTQFNLNRPGSPELGFGKRSKKIYTGPNGGTYYIKSGKKVYVRH